MIHSTVSETFGVGADLKLMESFTRATFVEYLTKVRGAIDRDRRASVDHDRRDRRLGARRRARAGSRLHFPDLLKVIATRASRDSTGSAPPAPAALERLTRLVGRDAALDLLLSGRRLDAAEAKSLGVVSRVADTDVLDAALSMAQSYARRPPAAARAILRCVEAALPYAAAPGLQFEEREMHELFDDADARRLVREFVADRRRRAEGSQAG